jgi:hypothetical protein
LIASSTGNVSISRSAASTNALYPVVMVCGMGPPALPDGGRAAAAAQANGG